MMIGIFQAIRPRGEDVLETLRHEVKDKAGIHTITTTKNLDFVFSTIKISLKGESDAAGLILSLCSWMCAEAVWMALLSEHMDAWVTLDEILERLMYKYPIGFLDLTHLLKSMHEDLQLQSLSVM